MRKLSLTVIALSLTAFLGFFSPAIAQTTVVVPNDLENTEGANSSISPFSCPAGFSSLRTQQLNLSSQFPEAGLIDRISFRLDNFIGTGASGFGPTVVPDVIIQLSTTQAEPLLSPTFANNVGPDVQTVFSGNLTLSAPDCNTEPCPFDIMIPLQNSFFYNPENGNLLLDIRTPTCTSIPDIDFTSSSGTVALLESFDVDSETGRANTAVGNVIQFQLRQQPRFITLSPASATNDAGTEHTVTATVLTNGTPDPGELVTFEVISGPNAGEMSDPNSGECTSNDDCTTDTNGQVSWTYTGEFPGRDTIVASFTDITGVVIESDPAEKLWIPPPRPIPTLSEWGLIITAGILGMIGLMVIRRRKLRARL